MGVLLVIGIVLGILILLELLKHHFTKGLMKYMIICLILILVLLILSSYIDFGALVGKESTFAKTGAVIAEGVEKDVEDIDFDESKTLAAFSEKTKEFLQKAFDN